ncbi:MAG: hypothetical protein MJ252_22125 [archaeon]|nr:hypothetical protein [archaeon]
MKENEPKIKELNEKSGKELFDSFKDDCIEIKKKAMEDYDKTASNYDEKIYKEVRKELESNIEQKLFQCFNKQVNRIIPMMQKFMRIDLKKKIEAGGKIRK